MLTVRACLTFGVQATLSLMKVLFVTPAFQLHLQSPAYATWLSPKLLKQVHGPANTAFTPAEVFEPRTPTPADCNYTTTSLLCYRVDEAADLSYLPPRRSSSRRNCIYTYIKPSAVIPRSFSVSI